jgi:hypothetical protein
MKVNKKELKAIKENTIKDLLGNSEFMSLLEALEILDEFESELIDGKATAHQRAIEAYENTLKNRHNFEALLNGLAKIGPLADLAPKVKELNNEMLRGLMILIQNKDEDDEMEKKSLRVLSPVRKEILRLSRLLVAARQEKLTSLLQHNFFYPMTITGDLEEKFGKETVKTRSAKPDQRGNDETTKPGRQVREENEGDEKDLSYSLRNEQEFSKVAALLINTFGEPTVAHIDGREVPLRVSWMNTRKFARDSDDGWSWETPKGIMYIASSGPLVVGGPASLIGALGIDKMGLAG